MGDTTEDLTKTLTEAELAAAIGPYTLEHLLEAYEADRQCDWTGGSITVKTVVSETLGRKPL